MIFSTKAVTQAVTSALTFIAAALVARLGFNADPAVTAAVPGVIAWVAGMLSAFIVKEEALLAPTLSKVEGEVKDRAAFVDERFRAIEARLPGPVRLDVQAAAADLVTDAKATEADVVADAPAVAADVEAGNVKAAETAVADDAKSELTTREQQLEQQLRDLGVDPDTGKFIQPRSMHPLT